MSEIKYIQKRKLDAPELESHLHQVAQLASGKMACKNCESYKDGRCSLFDWECGNPYFYCADFLERLESKE